MENRRFEYSIRSKGDIRSCFVYGCFSTAANNNKTIGFHKFPPRGSKKKVVVTKKNGDKSIYDRRQLWLEALNIKRQAAHVIDQLNIYVCSLHFSRNDYYYNQDVTGRRYLKELAIPRRNLPARFSSPLTTRFIVRHLNRLRYRGYFNLHNPDGRKLTARRRFLGANKADEESSQKRDEESPHHSSFTKTVWVPRKPKEQNQPEEEDLAGVSGISVSSAFSLAGIDQDCLDATADGVFSPEEFLDTRGDEEDQEQEFDQNYQQIVEAEEGDLPHFNIEGVEFDAADEMETSVEYDATSDYNTEEPIYGENGFEEANVTSTSFVDDNTDELIYGENGYQEVNQSTYFLEQQNDLYNSICRVCGALNCPGHRKRSIKENVFVCLFCNDIFTSQKQLDRHTRASHGVRSTPEEIIAEERDKLTCGVCGRVLSTRSTLKEHVMIHTGEKPHECMLCGRTFRHKANLVVHVNSHAGLAAYKCKRCNQAFTKKSEFDKHLRLHVDRTGAPLVCSICSGVFKSQRTLHNHMMLHDKNGSVAKRKKKTHPNLKFPCQMCGRQLATKATLKEHMMIHSGERPHECPHCGRMIRHKANYVMHLQTHGQGRSYECDMCDQAFVRKVDLQAHKRERHAEAKLMRCAICGQVFKSPSKFNRHMEMHESVAYINETEQLTGYQPHLLEGFLETDDGVLEL